MSTKEWTREDWQKWQRKCILEDWKEMNGSNQNENKESSY